MKRILKFTLSLIVIFLSFGNYGNIADANTYEDTIVSIGILDIYTENNEEQIDLVNGGFGVMLDNYGTVAYNNNLLDVSDYSFKGQKEYRVCIRRDILAFNICNFSFSIIKEYEDLELGFAAIDRVYIDEQYVDIEPSQFEYLKYKTYPLAKEFKLNETAVVVDKLVSELQYESTLINSSDLFEDLLKGNKDEYYYMEVDLPDIFEISGVYNLNTENLGIPLLYNEDVLVVLKSQVIQDKYETEIKPLIDLKSYNDQVDMNRIKTNVLFEYPFLDVDIYDVNYGVTYFLSKDGIIDGYPDRTFRPDDTINRAEFAKLIYESLMSDEYKSEGLNNCFPDVRDQWFAEPVCNLNKIGVIEGYDDGNFRPSENINFVEAAKIASALIYGESVNQSTPWYKYHVKNLGNSRAIPYSIKSFDEIITRGQVASMLYRLYYTDSLSSDMKYEDFNSERLERIDLFVKKYENFVEETSNFENIAFRSVVTNYLDDKEFARCERNFITPTYDIYSLDSKSYADLLCIESDTQEISYNYGIMRIGNEIQYRGIDQPVQFAPLRSRTIDAKGYKVLDNVIKNKDYIYDVEVSNNVYKLKIDPILGTSTRILNSHFSSLSNADDFYVERSINLPLTYVLEISFTENGLIENFIFSESWVNQKFERIVNLDYSIENYSYEFIE